jgi:hypothetical protein
MKRTWNKQLKILIPRLDKKVSSTFMDFLLKSSTLVPVMEAIGAISLSQCPVKNN